MSLRVRRRAPLPEPAEALRAAAEPLPPLDDASAFGAIATRWADARLVLIGEASHGTSEFYRARELLTRQLVAQHGFSIVAVEADWPDAAHIDRYVRQRPPPPAGERPFQRFPGWMWSNVEVREFVHWLHAHNARCAEQQRVEFRGLDVYSLQGSIAAVLRYLDRVDPAAARLARERYGCLSPWQADPSHYGRLVRHGLDTCEQAVVQQLRELLDARLRYLAHDGEDFFDAAQNARIVQAAERYYRVMYQGSRASWNLRDTHMFETLTRLLDRRPGARAVVWAHNSHLGDARATAMGRDGELNLGQLCRQAWGDAVVLVGQGTDRGTVAAAHDWDEPMQTMTVQPSLPDSWERACVDAGLTQALADWRAPAAQALREALSAERLQRAIGVVYRPHTERWSHYFEATLARQFDAWLWFAQTRALTPLGRAAAEGVPDTYPFGV